MEKEEFLKQVRLLTGTEVKGAGEIDHNGLSGILSDESRVIDFSQLNELLLLVHKDRVEKPFFEHFFGPAPRIGQIAAGVERFQRTALLLYGNFVYGYRRLSRIKSTDEFSKAIAESTKEPAEELEYFLNRRPKLLEVDRIDKVDTPYVGYLSAGEIRADFRRCELMVEVAREIGAAGDWAAYSKELREMATEAELGVLESIVTNYKARNLEAEIGDFSHFLSDSLDSLSRLNDHVNSVQTRARKNQNTYLTWDHMDVYFATSMRKAWEYKDLFEFIESLTKSDEIRDLGLRYFDPTQAFTDNRVNKGLVEALMLKRARCTVYSVQDTDTLGKDSELASTLAQGKPVIAYIPDIQPEARAQQLAAEDPQTILERLRFVLYADEQLSQRISDEEYNVVARVEDQLTQFVERRVWQSVRSIEEVEEFRSATGTDLLTFCKVIATSEKAVYDKRANTLKKSHPLAVQVNLATGVANGVLVVRTVSDCASLLRRVLTSDMEFLVQEEDGMWYLREKISGCVYRVVTNDRKLNNCFWNFYLR